ncbi:hypothetical protein ASPCADRAFT_206116, partial [Aspergillus carbonarius ITEM 5010]
MRKEGEKPVGSPPGGTFGAFANCWLASSHLEPPPAGVCSAGMRGMVREDCSYGSCNYHGSWSSQL